MQNCLTLLKAYQAISSGITTTQTAQIQGKALHCTLKSCLKFLCAHCSWFSSALWEQLTPLPLALHKVQSLSASDYVPHQSANFPSKRESGNEFFHNTMYPRNHIFFHVIAITSQNLPKALLWRFWPVANEYILYSKWRIQAPTRSERPGGLLDRKQKLKLRGRSLPW